MPGLAATPVAGVANVPLLRPFPARMLTLSKLPPVLQIIFPQFGPDGPLPNHGFARTSTWRFECLRGTAAVFSLTDSPDTHAIWDQAFRLELAITLHATGFDSALT